MKQTLAKPSNFKLLIAVLLANLISLASSQLARAVVYTWNVATPSSSSDWNNDNNWTPNTGYPGSGATADTAVFDSVGTSGSATTVNNVVNVSTTISTLLYTNAVSGGWHVTDIPVGVTLTATNVVIGTNATTFVTDVAMTDAGTFMVRSNMLIGDGGISANDVSTVNFGGLSNFVYNASGGTINIGPTNYSIANFTLAGWSNNITAGTIDDNINASSSSGNSSCTLTLAGWTNIINVGTFDVAYGRNTTTVGFPAGTAGGLLLNCANLELGSHNTSGSGSHAFGTFAFDGNPVDITVQNLTLGQSGSTPTGLSYGEGVLSFDTGSLYASNITMAVTVGSTQTGSPTENFAQGIGQLNVGSAASGNATLFIGSGGLSLVNQTNNSTTVAATSTGTLAITNGTVISSNSIIQSSSLGTSTITLNGGTLYMVSGTVGTASLPITTMNLFSGTLTLSTSTTSTTTNINAATFNTSGTTAIVITNLTGAIPEFSTTTIPLITYSGSSPNGNLSLTINPAINLNQTTPSLSDDGNGHISLVFTPTVTPPPLVIWTGATNGNWDYVTTNWADAGNPTNYADGNFVQFDDTLLSNNVINLTATLSPYQTTVSNFNENYTFTGIGSVATGALLKLGTAGLILDNSAANNFSSVAISNGTVQVGNNDANGSLGSGPVTDNGSLVLDRSDTALNLSSTISGTGSVTGNGSGGSSVALSGANSFTGGVNFNGGALVVNQSSSLGSSGTITFNGGTLQYGLLGTVTNTTDYSSRFNTANNQQYNIDLPTFGNVPYSTVQVTFASPLTSSGGALTKTGGGELILTGTNTFTGGIFIGGGMVRANGTNGYGLNTAPIAITETAPGTEIYFNVGSWTYGNNLSIQGYGAVETDPAGTTLGAIRMASTGINLAGTITLTGNAGISPRSANPSEISGQITDGGHGYGIQFGRTSTSSSAGSGMLIISNTANSWGGDTTIADGFLKLGASGVIPNGAGAGNVVMTNAGTGFMAGITNSFFDLNGYNQTINGLSNSLGVTGGTLNMLWVTNDGASAVTLTLGNNNANGSFGGIIGGGANPSLSITKIGSGTQTLGGANTYNGNTTISAGSLALSGSASIANTPNIIVAGGATFDVSALSSAFTLGAGQTLSNSTSTANIKCGGAGLNSGSGTVSLTFASGTPSLSVGSGTLTVSGGTVLNINNTGTALSAGAYTLIAAGGGSVVGTVPTSYTVKGGGIAAGYTNSLQITSGALQLVVTSLAQPAVFTGMSVNGTTLTISATNGAPNGQYVLLESTNLLVPVSQWTPVFTNNFDGSGNLNVSTNVVNASNLQVFYILQMP